MTSRMTNGVTSRPTSGRPGSAGGDGKSKLFTRPAAASGFTDSESGDEGAGTEQELRALKVMLDRGLMSRADYDERRADLLSARDGAGNGRT